MLTCTIIMDFNKFQKRKNVGKKYLIQYILNCVSLSMAISQNHKINEDEKSMTTNKPSMMHF